MDSYLAGEEEINPTTDLIHCDAPPLPDHSIMLLIDTAISFKIPVSLVGITLLHPKINPNHLRVHLNNPQILLLKLNKPQTLLHKNLELSCFLFLQLRPLPSLEISQPQVETRLDKKQSPVLRQILQYFHNYQHRHWGRSLLQFLSDLSILITSLENRTSPILCWRVNAIRELEVTGYPTRRTESEEIFKSTESQTMESTWILCNF